MTADFDLMDNPLDAAARERDTRPSYRRRTPSGSGNTWVEAGIVFVTASAGIVWISRAADPGAPLVIGVYGIIALTCLFVKLLAAFCYQTYEGSTPLLSVAVVVPAFNEDPEMLARCLRSIADQTVQPVEFFFVIDDGSVDESAAWSTSSQSHLRRRAWQPLRPSMSAPIALQPTW